MKEDHDYSLPHRAYKLAIIISHQSCTCRKALGRDVYPISHPLYYCIRLTWQF